MLPSSSPAPDAPALFVATQPPGGLQLALPGTLPPTAVGQALRLAEAEPLVALLEAWFGIGFDLRPGTGVPPPGAEAAQVLHDGLAPAGTWLWLPTQLPASAPPEPLRTGLRWPALRARVAVHRLDPALRPRLRAGGLLWLAESFAARWPVTLQAEDPAHGTRAARLCPQSATLVLPAQPSPVESADDALWLHRPVTVPIDAWRGWCDTDLDVPLAMPLRCGPAAMTDAGALMPLGAGWGWQVARVPEPAWT